MSRPTPPPSAGGDTHGAPIGVLAIFFDWDSQANTVLSGVRLTEGERAQARCLILDANYRVIAASDRVGLLTEVYPLQAHQTKLGHYIDGDRVVGFALTPGYETYRGLGWFAAIEIETGGRMELEDEQTESEVAVAV